MYQDAFVITRYCTTLTRKIIVHTHQTHKEGVSRLSLLHTDDYPQLDLRNLPHITAWFQSKRMRIISSGGAHFQKQPNPCAHTKVDWRILVERE